MLQEPGMFALPECFSTKFYSLSVSNARDEAARGDPKAIAIYNFPRQGEQGECSPEEFQERLQQHRELSVRAVLDALCNKIVVAPFL